MSTATLTREPDTEEVEFRYTDHTNEKMYVLAGNHGAIVFIEDEDGPFDPGVEVNYADIPALIATLATILKDGNRKP